jgi:hypothetical protein
MEEQDAGLGAARHGRLASAMGGVPLHCSSWGNGRGEEVGLLA